MQLKVYFNPKPNIIPVCMFIIVVTINCYYCFISAMSVWYECVMCWVCVVRVPGSDWCWCSDVVRPHYEATTGHYHGLGAGEDRSPATLHTAHHTSTFHLIIR